MSQKLPNMLENTIAKLREMVDVNSVIGDPIKVSDELTLIPISKVTCGFAGGGSGFGSDPQNEHFGGGAGGCIKVNPVCFLVVKNDNVRMLPISDSMNGLDKLVDLLPEITDKIVGLVNAKKEEEV